MKVMIACFCMIRLFPLFRQHILPQLSWVFIFTSDITKEVGTSRVQIKRGLLINISQTKKIHLVFPTTVR